MKLFRKYTTVVLMGLALAGSVALTSCNDDKDEFSTEQFTGGVKLNVWGPCPVARGGELRFIGSGMDKVTGITLPGCDKITDLKHVSNEEVRLTVPQTAEPGYVTVHTSQGDITSITTLTFLEPISLDKISPLTVKAGQTLTLTGEYLNNIHEVLFSTDKATADVTIPEEDFLTHSRNEISFEVPVEAKTGSLILSDANEEMPNWIISDEEVSVVVPSVDEILTLDTANPGDVVTIKGKDLDLVVDVVMANGESVYYSYDGEYEGIGIPGTITITIPDNACQGAICLVTASNVEVVAVNIGECHPEDLTAVPATGLRGGDTVVISGKNLQMVAGVSLKTASADEDVDFVLENNEKLSFVFPASAQSGDVTLTLKGGGEVFIYIETAKPEILTTDMLAAGSTVTVTGKNLDLLTTITFSGGTTVAVENSSADQAVVTIPVTAQSGAATLGMANGETAEWVANISSPTGAYIIEGPSEEDEIAAGSVVTFTIGNPEMLSGVKVNSESVQYIVNGSTLFVNLPSSCGKGTTVTLESSDGSSLDYSYDFIPATHVGMTIWSGMFTCSGWNGNQDLAYGAFDWSSIPAGATMTISLTPLDPSAGWWCIALRNGNWVNITGDWGAQIDNPDGEISLELTQEVLDDLVANNGLIIFGDGYIMTQILVEWENSLEEAIWTGEWANSGWGGNQDLAWGGYDWSTVKAGSVLRAYCTPLVDEGAWWCISFRHGNGWGNLPGDVGSQIDTPEGGIAQITLTRDILDDLIENGGLVITGDGYTLTKVTLE